MFNQKAERIFVLESQIEQAKDLIRRFFVASGKYSGTTCGEWSWIALSIFESYVKDLEKEATTRLEREKIESIMRDLLKANVFKQV